jgi:hypothetical protein
MDHGRMMQGLFDWEWFGETGLESWRWMGESAQRSMSFGEERWLSSHMGETPQFWRADPLKGGEASTCY